MPVVKARESAHLRQSAIVMDLSDLERHAGQIVAEAKRQAGALLAQAKEEAAREGEQIRVQARESGYADGLAQGLAEGWKAGHDVAVGETRQRLEELGARWGAALEELKEGMPTHLADTKADVVRLALAVGARVTRLEALRERQVVGNTVGAALERVGAGRSVAVRVHPEELDALEKYVPVLLAKLRTISQVELQADETITPGGCVVQFGAGQIDATLETQIARIADELLARQG